MVAENSDGARHTCTAILAASQAVQTHRIPMTSPTTMGSGFRRPDVSTWHSHPSWRLHTRLTADRHDVYSGLK